MPDVWSETHPTGREPAAHRAIGELAAKQWGIVARRQLIATGLSERLVDARAARGELLRLHRGVYAVGHQRLRREGIWLAAVLAVPRGALSHRDAACLHGLRQANHAKVDVSTPGRGRLDEQGITVHRTRTLDAADLTTVSGIPVTTIARTLVDLAGTVPPDYLAKAIREAEHQRTLDTRAIEATLQRTRGRRGSGHATLTQALAEHASLATTLTDSALEVSFQRLIRDHHLPKPQTNVFIQDMRVDACWSEAHLVVELDGYAYHSDREAFQRDRERDIRLQLAGYVVLRFTHHDVTRRPHDIAVAVRQALAPLGREFRQTLLDSTP